MKKPTQEKVISELILNDRNELSECQKLFGMRVGRLAACWQEYGEDILFVTEVLLHKFVTHVAEDKVDVQRDKFDTEDLPDALSECLEEIRANESQKEDDKKEVVPKF